MPESTHMNMGASQDNLIPLCHPPDRAIRDSVLSMSDRKPVAHSGQKLLAIHVTQQPHEAPLGYVNAGFVLPLTARYCLLFASALVPNLTAGYNHAPSRRDA